MTSNLNSNHNLKPDLNLNVTSHPNLELSTLWPHTPDAAPQGRRPAPPRRGLVMLVSRYTLHPDGGRFLMSEVPLYIPMVVLGGGAVPYERDTPIPFVASSL